ncbi:hypothetical protein ACLOJK_035414 [Asimina triloba]
MGETMEGIASIALLSSGSISGHFIRLPHSTCYALHGTALVSEIEFHISGDNDHHLLQDCSKKEKVVVVECRGHDAARFHSIDCAHGQNLMEGFFFMDLEMVGRGTIARCIEGLLPTASESIRKNPTIHWENEIVSMVEGKHGKQKISVTFECETLKSENAAEEHIKQFLPNLVGLDAVVTFVSEMLESETAVEEHIRQFMPNPVGLDAGGEH